MTAAADQRTILIPSAQLLLLALVYFASARLGLYFPTIDSHITLFWFPTGMAAAILLRWGSPWIVGGIFLGAFLFDISLGTSIPLSLLSAAGNTLTPLTAVWLLRRWRFDPYFTRQYDLANLIAAAAISPLLPAAIGVVSLWMGGLLQPAGMQLAWFNWWLGDLMSILLVGPLFLSISRSSLAELRRRPVEMLLCALLLGISGIFVFFINLESHILPLAFLPLPMVLWAALRLGVTSASLSVLALSLLAAIGTAMGKGVFGALPAEEGMYMAWVYMFVAALVGLMATTMLGERKKIEASLRSVNDLLRETQSIARIGSWRLDLPSNELIWSDESYRIFGIAPGTPLTYESFLGMVHPDDKAMVDSAWQAALAGEPYRIQHRILVDGKARWVEERAQLDLDEDGKVLSGTGSVQDITDSKEAQQRFQHSESRYKALLQQAADSMFIHDFNGRILEVNQQACDTLGYSSEELCGMHLEVIAPNFQLNVNQPRWELLEPGKPVCFESTHRRKNGTTFPIEVRLVSLEIDNQKLVMALASDITERRQLEEKLHQSMRQLEQKELSKTRFLAAAGHDLRQPIAAANLYVDTLKLCASGEHQTRLINRLEQSMSVFSSLLESLLNISKFDAGLIKPHFSSFDLAELFLWVEQNYAQTARSNDLDLRLFFPLDRRLIVRTDIGLLQSVVMNLVSNAIKFTTRGAILLSARVRGERVLLQVWDTGCGIAEADLPYIFDEFYQANNHQRSREAGLGLGLSICQRTMMLLGGKITCRSRPGHGSVFELNVPLDTKHGLPGQVSSLGTATDEPFDTTLLKGKRVVVLEDDSLVASGLLGLMQDLGAEVLHFPSTEDALHHEHARQADFFIVDFALSGKLTGIDFLKAMQHGKQDPIRAVVITGETSSSFISSSKDLPWPVLHKPVNLAKLHSSLHRQTIH